MMMNGLTSILQLLVNGLRMSILKVVRKKMVWELKGRKCRVSLYLETQTLNKSMYFQGWTEKTIPDDPKLPELVLVLDTDPCLIWLVLVRP